jgi:hypothetical protein
VRSKMGDLEAILAQSLSAAAFGDRGYWLILIGMCLKWSVRMSAVIGTFVYGIMYGPSAAAFLGKVLSRYL